MENLEPPLLRPTRNLELLRTEADVPGPCCTCKKSPGNVTCVGCKAIKYCSQECQNNGWNDHKDDCDRIKEGIAKVKAAVDALSEEFGGIDALLQSPLVKERDFKDEHPYIKARLWLSMAYADCGRKASSCAAFQLAAENNLDILCLTLSELDLLSLNMVYLNCGYMVAGGMDQQALDYLCYFQQCQDSPYPLPNSESSKDIEEDSYVDMFSGETAMYWIHANMMIALIKYKRLQSLMVWRKKNMASWKMFMMGTHSRVGEESTIQKIKGNALVVEKLKGFVMKETINFRIERLNNQVKQILCNVNKHNHRTIPTLVKNISNPGNTKDPLIVSMVSAWKMSPSYNKVLQLFLDEGDVICGHTDANKPGGFPVEGFPQAAFDVDPSRLYDGEDDLGTLDSLSFFDTL